MPPTTPTSTHHHLRDVYVTSSFNVNHTIHNPIVRDSTTHSTHTNPSPTQPTSSPPITDEQKRFHSQHICFTKPDAPISLFLYNATGRSTTHTHLTPGNFPLYNPSDYDPSSLLIRPSLSPSELPSFRLVLCLSAEFSSVSSVISSTLRSLALLQNSFSLHVVFFTASPVVIPLCNTLNIDVIPSYMWDPTLFLISRSNFAGLPVVPELLKACKKLYSADFYGYVNSDILIAPSLFTHSILS